MKEMNIIIGHVLMYYMFVFFDQSIFALRKKKPKHTNAAV